jgi:hypothetical protein
MREFNGTVTIRRSSSKIQREVTIAGKQSGDSFDLREESVEILALGTFVVSQSGLHQTTEAKSVMLHAHYSAAMRTLGFMLGCSK